MKLSLRPLNQSNTFCFEYALRYEALELEGMEYLGIGVTAKMVDGLGNEVEKYIGDVTTEPQVAQRLLEQLDAFKVSPMCLPMFVEDFLSRI